MIQSIKTLVFILPLIALAFAAMKALLTRDAWRDVGARSLQATLALNVVLFLAPNAWVMLALLVTIIPMFKRDRADVAGLYILLSLLVPAITKAVSIGSFNYIMGISAQNALAIGALVALLSVKRPAGHRGRFDIPFLILFALTLAWSLRGETPTGLIRGLVNQALSLALPYYVIARSIDDRQDFRRVILHMITAGMMLTFLMVFESLRHWPLYADLLARTSDFQLGIGTKMRAGMMRATGPMLEPMTAGFAMTICCIVVYTARSAFRTRAHHILAIALVFAGAMMPQSRNVWIGLAAAIVALELFRGAYARIAVAAVTGAFALAAATAAGSGVTSFFSSAETRDSNDYRERLYHRGLEEIWESPLVGRSLPTVRENMRDMVQGEGFVDFVNGYIFIGLTAGLIGLSLFVLSLLMIVGGVLRTRRKLAGDPALSDLGAALFAAIASTIPMFAFIGVAGTAQVVLMYLAALTAGLLTALARQKARSPHGGKDDATPGRVSAADPSPALPQLR